jgi:hypothetical protein
MTAGLRPNGDVFFRQLCAGDGDPPGPPPPRIGGDHAVAYPPPGDPRAGYRALDPAGAEGEGEDPPRAARLDDDGAGADAGEGASVHAAERGDAPPTTTPRRTSSSASVSSES